MDGTGTHTSKQKKMVISTTNNLLNDSRPRFSGIAPQVLFIVENSFNVIRSTFGKQKIY